MLNLSTLHLIEKSQLMWMQTFAILFLIKILWKVSRKLYQLKGSSPQLGIGTTKYRVELDYNKFAAITSNNSKLFCCQMTHFST